MDEFPANTAAAATIVGGGEALLAQLRTEASAPGLTRIRLAPGYLYVPGLMPLWEALAQSAASEIHLLIGNTAGMLTDEQQVAVLTHQEAWSHVGITPEYDVAAPARQVRGRVVAQTAGALRENLLRLPSGPESEQFLFSLARAVGANRVRVRIYAEGRLHAKASLFENADSCRTVAIVGSSNLTLPAAPGTLTEMNVVLREAEAVHAAHTWFDTLWNAGHDFTRTLFTELSQHLVSGGEAM
jgi:hypothetical protein